MQPTHHPHTHTHAGPQVIHLASQHPTHRMITDLHLPLSESTIILNGATAPPHAVLYTQVQPLLQEGLVPWLVTRRASIITGGTNAGIFAVLGQGFARWDKPAACIGVTIDQPMQAPDGSRGHSGLEPHHSHCLLVPGSRWGDETEAMYALAEVHAPPHRSIAISIGGGSITLYEIEAKVRVHRAMILIAGSGGVADAVLTAETNAQSNPSRYAAIRRLGTIYALPLTTAPAQLGVILERLLP